MLAVTEVRRHKQRQQTGLRGEEPVVRVETQRDCQITKKAAEARWSRSLS